MPYRFQWSNYELTAYEMSRTPRMRPDKSMASFYSFTARAMIALQALY